MEAEQEGKELVIDSNQTLQGSPLTRCRNGKATAHPIWIGMMWTFYLLIPFFSAAKVADGISLLPLTMTFSIISFLVAIWLVFQRSRVDVLNGGAKLLLDMAMTIALIGFLVRTGALMHVSMLLRH